MTRPALSRFLLPALLVLTVVITPIAGARTSAAWAQGATPAADARPADQIPALLATCDTVFGVLILDQNDQVIFEQNADVPFVSASLYKLVLLAETLARVESGELALDQRVTIQSDFYLAANGDDSYFSYQAVGYEATIEELIYSAGAYSSNVGAQALVSLTSPQRLEEFAKKLGLSETRYWLDAEQVNEVYQLAGDPPSLDFVRSVAFIESFTGYGVVNLTTPRDMATFFRLLRDDQLVSPLVSWQLKHVLDARVINDRIPALLPGSTTVIHKTGNLEGVLHDVGIVETPGGPVITVLLAQAATDFEATRSVEQRLGLLAYEIGAGAEIKPDNVATPVARVPDL